MVQQLIDSYSTAVMNVLTVEDVCDVEGRESADKLYEILQDFGWISSQ